MEFIEVIAVVFISIFLGSVFFYGFRRRGPWGSFWSFLMVIFLGILLFDIWTEPVGPIWYGVGWIDLLFIGLIFALLLSASSPTDPKRTYRSTTPEEAEAEAGASVIAIGVFFWLLIILLITSIAIGIWAV